MMNQLKAELTRLAAQIKPLEKKIDELEDDWQKHIDKKNPNDQFELNTVLHAGRLLYEIRKSIENMNAKVVAEGTLFRNAAGRFEMKGGNYYTSGSPIEFLLVDEDGEGAWIASRVEHSQDYYIVSNPRVKMDGLRVRVRERKFDW
ncbi:DUF5348 domain-containing protein [Paenibacillus koleovorans]|uniref:DUF5348 domain-containing protein n=1 Tax=Paenibacillus koleovorans TaxID=121608 RepID=UPI000FD7175E|nr:DUF5348 domain-containing protein [Paenibacillus koleovorans]